uniref:Purinergic receptor P2X, ligand-gated ion channel, 4b n=1 Tax=Cyprinus carpio TaxID=7962 RepID=A0A8C1SK98_CYPCA
MIRNYIICLQCLFGYETNVMLVINNKVHFYNNIQHLNFGRNIDYSVISSVSTKVKGNILTNSSAAGVHVWDVPEYVIPPQGENTFFVLTNVIPTLGQRQSKCPEIPSEVTKCESDSDCKEGYSEVHGNGVQTGRCVQYSDTIKTCEVQAWCPLENDTVIPK